MARRNRHNRRRRRGRFAFLYKVLCLALIAGAIVAAMAVFFKADQVEVTGNSRYTAEEIIAASGVETGDNLFFLNKYDVAERISGALPYVESVRINRSLPDTLRISITECTCAVSLEQNGTVWLLCDTGKIVDAVEPDVASGYAKVTGLTLLEPQVGAPMTADETNEAARQQLLTILQQLRAKDMLSDVQEIHLEEASVITIRYLDRFDVEFLWGADFDYKLSFLAAVVGKLEDNERGTLKLTRDGEVRFITE